MTSISELSNIVLKTLVRSKTQGATAPSLQRRYKLLNVLGRGASGVVVQAHDPELDRPVAIKLSPAALASEAMIAEARALAGLKRHPNVVQVFEAQKGSLQCGSVSFDVAYIVMELIEGASLRAWTASAEPSEIMSAYIDVAEGLAFTHAQDVVHGDVKPDNVVVRASGEPVLIDFGFSAPISAGDRDVIVGTEDYMAPEVLRGSITAASDVYALAVSLWEALEGRLPLSGHMERRIPRSLHQPLRKAMSPAASDRPSVDALAKAIRRTLSRERVARPLSYAAVLLCLMIGVGLGYRGWVVHGAEQAYRQRVQAWNERDSARFVDAYAEEFCHYNEAHQTRSGLLSPLQPYFDATCQGQMQVSLTPRSVGTDEVVFEVKGERERTYGTCSGRSRIHVLVRLARQDDGWRIVDEGSDSLHRCWQGPPEFSLDE